MRALLVSAALLAGCTTAPVPVSTPAPAPLPQPAPRTEPAPSAEPAPRTENIAVASLMETARGAAAAGELASAAASLERALRIEPRNPRLWHELARVRLRQGNYAQTESLAARSNSWASEDSALRAGNWRLIAEAREARGDRAGAREALKNAGAR
jgi:tetratricopeptide (TPR) repeat protein